MLLQSRYVCGRPISTPAFVDVDQEYLVRVAQAIQNVMQNLDALEYSE